MRFPSALAVLAATTVLSLRVAHAAPPSPDVLSRLAAHGPQKRKKPRLYRGLEEREKGFELSQGLEIPQRVRRVVHQARETIQVPFPSVPFRTPWTDRFRRANSHRQHIEKLPQHHGKGDRNFVNLAPRSNAAGARPLAGAPQRLRKGEEGDSLGRGGAAAKGGRRKSRRALALLAVAGTAVNGGPRWRWNRHYLAAKRGVGTIVEEGHVRSAVHCDRRLSAPTRQVVVGGRAVVGAALACRAVHCTYVEDGVRLASDAGVVGIDRRRPASRVKQLVSVCKAGATGREKE